MCFQLHQGLVLPFPQALPKQELGNGISRAQGDILGFKGEACQGSEERWAEVLLAANNTEESASYPFY